MKDIEQRIRELPLPGPSEALDARIGALLSPDCVARSSPRSRWSALVATALAAGVAGFAAGLGTGQWLAPPSEGQSIADSAPVEGSRAIGTPTSYVQFTDSRIGAGLDFSQSLEPFQVHPTSQEGS